MDYRIFNDKIIADRAVRERVRNLIAKKIQRLERFNSNYSKKLVTEFYFSKPAQMNYQVSALVKLKETVLLIKEKGTEPEALIHLLFDKLKPTLDKKLNLEKKTYLRRKHRSKVMSLTENIDLLKELKTEGQPEVFREIIKVLLKDVAAYIDRRLKTAEITRAVRKGEFGNQDLLNEFYLFLYDHIMEIPVSIPENNTWIYREADEFLSRKFRESEFEQEKYDRFEDLLAPDNERETDQFTADADYEIIPVEELDDYDTGREPYHVYDLFIGDNEDSILDDITLRFNKTQISKMIEKELARLPVMKRTIMDYFIVHQMTIDEIAMIRQLSPTEVEGVIEEVSTDLKRKLASKV